MQFSINTLFYKIYRVEWGKKETASDTFEFRYRKSVRLVPEQMQHKKNFKFCFTFNLSMGKCETRKKI